MAVFNKKIRCLADDLNYIPGMTINQLCGFDCSDSHPNLRTDELYDSCFLQAISESDMHECHQEYLDDYIKTGEIKSRCCTQHFNLYYVYKRANELYEELKNGNF